MWVKQAFCSLYIGTRITCAVTKLCKYGGFDETCIASKFSLQFRTLLTYLGPCYLTIQTTDYLLRQILIYLLVLGCEHSHHFLVY